MHALIVDDHSDQQSKLAIAFMRSGFQTTSTGNHTVADCCIRGGLVDILVMSERVEGRLTHALSLLAECRNHAVETILITSRTDADIDELFLLLPSLHVIVAPDTAPEMITKLAISAVAGSKKRCEPLILKTSERLPDVAENASIFTSTRTPMSRPNNMMQTA